MNTKLILILISAILLTACQSVPQAVSGDYSPVTINEARKSPNSQAVRWGGVIAKVENQEKQTVIEVVAKPLGSSARPRDVDATSGRFLAIIPEFIDPVVYKEGREVTVTGNLSEIIEGKIGEMDYLFPVVSVSGHYLWKERKEYRDWHHYHYPVSYWPTYHRFFYYPVRHYHPKKKVVRSPNPKSTK